MSICSKDIKQSSQIYIYIYLIDNLNVIALISLHAYIYFLKHRIIFKVCMYICWKDSKKKGSQKIYIQ